VIKSEAKLGIFSMGYAWMAQRLGIARQRVMACRCDWERSEGMSEVCMLGWDACMEGSGRGGPNGKWVGWSKVEEIGKGLGWAGLRPDDDGEAVSTLRTPP
jgi:hypothetical protein